MRMLPSSTSVNNRKWYLVVAFEYLSQQQEMVSCCCLREPQATIEMVAEALDMVAEALDMVAEALEATINSRRWLRLSKPPSKLTYLHQIYFLH
jgi:hypothetical protein